MTDSMLSRPAWMPLDFPLVNSPGNRSAGAYLAVMRQLDVVNNQRYWPADPRYGLKNGVVPRATKCNIFAWDVTTAMKCEVPHWFDPATGEPTAMGRGSEMGIWDGSKPVDMVWWFLTFGQAKEWDEVDRAFAERHAGKGCPALVTWSSASPHADGHVAMVAPGGLIVQAGASNLWLAALAAGFGNHKPLRFWIHP